MWREDGLEPATYLHVQFAMLITSAKHNPCLGDLFGHHVHLKKAEDFIKAIIVLFCFCLNSLA